MYGAPRWPKHKRRRDDNAHGGPRSSVPYTQPIAEHLHIERRPTLRRPVLVAAFRGWNDGAQGASLAASFLAQSWGARRFAEIDPEEFFDFQATRPHVALGDGATRRIEWPETIFYHAEMPGLERDVVLLIGVEPNIRWRTFTDAIIGLARELDVELLVTLGALLADVPHTRPAPVTGSATDSDLIRELGLTTSRYEGPTGIVGVLHDACRARELPSASLWAAVPHYASLAASPKAALALCSRLTSLLGATVDLSDLERAAEAYERQVSEAVAQDADTEAYVHDLEERRDALGDELDVPSGDALAAELTRFLREHEARRNEEAED
ncbi:MAG: PAC2 family protein [Actinobacteria bacterium]|nr:PAC2 family protein [Actinomycetota bacterium]